MRRQASPQPAPARRRSLPVVGSTVAAWRFFKDRKASLFVKILFLLALAYVVMPVDAVPDVLPVVGWLDDLGVVAIASAFLWRAIEPYRYIDA
jgi:uncharacterized membrane protein YkvA (DUF1232 family)